MKIAQVAPLAERVPPKKYGGTERVIHALTEELVRRGHEVTLFASGDSETSADLRSVYPRSLREAKLPDPYGLNNLELLNMGVVYDLQGAFDIIHDHRVPMSLPVANIATTPVIATMHGPFTPENRRLFEMLNRVPIVSISESQAKSLPTLNHAGTVYNGLPLAHYPFGETFGEYLLFVGRLSMEKGAHIAIRVAQELDMPLVLAAKLDAVDMPYFNEYIAPRLSERIRWIGEVDEEERNSLMAAARCMLHPITWREPFGLVLIEAMACGCPVVAFGRGSIPEVVKEGVGGFVVEDTGDMIAAVEGIERIDRAACRAYALSTFNERRMTDGYEALYRAILEKASF